MTNLINKVFQLICVLVLVLSLVKCEFEEIGSNQNLVRCTNEKCDPDLQCNKKGSVKVKKPNSCCAECECGPCSELDFSVCTIGFKPYKQVKRDDECCDKVVCVSESNTDITNSIFESVHQETKTTVSKSNVFSPSNVLDDSNEDILLSVDNEQDEDYDDFYLDSADGNNRRQILDINLTQS
jgi:hypothetical protein